MKLVHPPSRNPDLPFGRLFCGVQEPQQRSFPRSRWPGQKNELAGFDLEIERTENEPPLVVLGNVAESNHEPRRARPSDLPGLAWVFMRPLEPRIVSLGPAPKFRPVRTQQVGVELSVHRGTTMGYPVKDNPGEEIAVGGQANTSGHACGMGPTSSEGEGKIDTSFFEIDIAGERSLNRSFNGARMAFGLGPSIASGPVEERIARLLTNLEPQIHSLRWGHQVHGAVIASIATEGGRSSTGAACVGRCDALITAETGLGLIVWTADCVPILLEGDGVIAAVHSGWRGTAADIVGRVVRRFEIEYGVPADRLQAALGPAICGQCYEVGTDVISALEKLCLDSEVWRHDDRVDLRAFLHLRLCDLGLRTASIQMVGPCTAESDSLASFRRDGAGAGRQFSLIYRV